MIADKTPSRERVVEGRGEGMLGSQSVAHRERPDSRRPPRLGDHAAMAEDRAGAIAAAMEKHQDGRGVTAWRDRPFAGHSVKIGRGKSDVGGGRPDGANLIEALAPLGPSDGPWLRTQVAPGWPRSRSRSLPLLPLFKHLLRIMLDVEALIDRRRTFDRIPKRRRSRRALRCPIALRRGLADRPGTGCHAIGLCRGSHARSAKGCGNLSDAAGR